MAAPTLHRLKLLIGFLLMLISGGALVGWMTGNHWLASWASDSGDRMAIPAAACFLLAGLFIFIQAHHWIRSNR